MPAFGADAGRGISAAGDAIFAGPVAATPRVAGIGVFTGDGIAPPGLLTRAELPG
jgi:hypothetical protein